MRFPVHSLTGNNPAQTDMLQKSLYLRELERQAKIASRSIVRAWRQALVTDMDPEQVFADLQAAMFSCIIIERILMPHGPHVRKRDGVTQAEAARQATERGAWLCKELRLTRAVLRALRVGEVRNSLEHFDERLDDIVSQGYGTVSDWYVSHGLIARTPQGMPPAKASVGLRAFDAPDGLLIFDQTEIDLYTLDAALLFLRDRVDASLRNVGDMGWLTFMSTQMVIRTAERGPRVEHFLRSHERFGEPVDLTGLAVDGIAAQPVRPNAFQREAPTRIDLRQPVVRHLPSADLISQVVAQFVAAANHQ